MVLREEDPKMSLKDASRVRRRKPKLRDASSGETQAGVGGEREEQNRVVM